MEKMENMENPKKLAVATIAGLTEVAGMAAPAMADETAADPTVGQTQSADPTKDACTLRPSSALMARTSTIGV